MILPFEEMFPKPHLYLLAMLLLPGIRFWNEIPVSFGPLLIRCLILLWHLLGIQYLLVLTSLLFTYRCDCKSPDAGNNSTNI